MWPEVVVPCIILILIICSTYILFGFGTTFYLRGIFNPLCFVGHSNDFLELIKRSNPIEGIVIETTISLTNWPYRPLYRTLFKLLLTRYFMRENNHHVYDSAPPNRHVILDDEKMYIQNDYPIVWYLFI